MKGKGSTTETLNQTQIKGNVSFDAALKITVQIPDTKGGQALKSQINALVAQGNGVGLDYLNALAANPNVKWDQVALAHEKWSYDQAGLTPAGAALLSIVVAAYMPGASGLFGTTTATGTTLGGVALTTTTATFAGAALNAGFTALASQAAVAMVNNKGDIGKTLEQLGKEESIKNLLTTMVTAGALDKLNQSLSYNGVSFSEINAKSTFGSQLLKNVTNNLASSAIDAALNGKAFDEKTLSAALANGLITTGMNKGANAIGNAASASVDANGTAMPAQIDAFTQKVAHAVLGCAAGAATAGNGSGCAPGAVGAVVGEMAAEYYMDSNKDNGKSFAQNKADALAFAKVMSATAGVIVGGGGDNAAAVNIANTTGANAAENNYLAHSEATARAALRDKQAKGPLSPAEQQQLTNLEVLDIARDLALKDACQTQGDICNAARRDLNIAIASYAAAGGTNSARLSAAGNQSVAAERNQSIALSNDPTLANQTLWDSFKEFAIPQAAGYAGGAVLGKFLSEAQAVYAAIKAEASAVGTTAATKLPVATDATATSPYSSSGTSYGKTTLKDVNGNPIATQPTLPGVSGEVVAAGKTVAGEATPITPLDWSLLSKTGETRAAHINAQHGNLNLQKPSQGVFYGDPVAVTNDAWNIAQTQGIKPITANGVDIYVIPRPNSGYAGGYKGVGDNLNSVTILTEPGTSKMITSYPGNGTPLPKAP